MSAKTPCIVTRPYFATNARPLTVTVTDEHGKVLFQQAMYPREFQTGSMGWNANGKGQAPVGPVDRPTVQIGVNITLVGSKELPPAVIQQGTSQGTAHMALQTPVTVSPKA